MLHCLQNKQKQHFLDFMLCLTQIGEEKCAFNIYFQVTLVSNVSAVHQTCIILNVSIFGVWIIMKSKICDALRDFVPLGGQI